MCIVDSPIAGNKHMYRDESARRCFTSTQCVEVDAFFAVFPHNFLNQLLFAVGQCRVHETRNRTTHKLHASPNDIKSHSNRNERIKNIPASESCDRHAA